MDGVELSWIISDISAAADVKYFAYANCEISSLRSDVK